MPGGALDDERGPQQGGPAAKPHQGGVHRGRYGRRGAVGLKCGSLGVLGSWGLGVLESWSLGESGK
jgi:hypothetical protein